MGNKDLRKKVKSYNSTLKNELEVVNTKLDRIEGVLDEPTRKSFSDKIVFIITVGGLIISLVALALSFQANKFSFDNADLEYETKVYAGDLSNTSDIDMGNGVNRINLPLKVRPKINQGKVKAVYSIVNNGENDYSITKLRKSKNNEIEPNYILQGTAEQIEKEPIDMFVLYVDYSNNISYDYVLILPEYSKHSAASIINEEPNTQDGLMLMGVRIKTFSQYNLLSREYYEQELIDEDYTILEHDEVLKEIKETKKYFSDLIL